MWDLFIDELDRGGQAGNAADVIIPATLHPEAPAGKRFGELTRVDIPTLAQFASRAGRRGDDIKDIWQRMQQKLKAQARAKSQAERSS
jgi:ABC-type transporter Mla subunit MlaD